MHKLGKVGFQTFLLLLFFLLKIFLYFRIDFFRKISTGMLVNRTSISKIPQLNLSYNSNFFRNESSLIIEIIYNMSPLIFVFPLISFLIKDSSLKCKKFTSIIAYLSSYPAAVPWLHPLIYIMHFY